MTPLNFDDVTAMPALGSATAPGSPAATSSVAAPAAVLPPESDRQSPEALLSIVAPVFNEVEVLETLVRQIHAAAARCGLRHEIVLVNDGSTDGSEALLDALARRDSALRVVHLSRNFGHQAAVQAGLSHARGDAVALMDADLQDAPEALARFVERWRAGADVVYAIRADRKEAAWKRALFAGFHQLLSRITRGAIPADAGNFSLIDGRLVREITALGERDRYLPGLRSWVGFRQEGIVVERQARYDDQPRVSLWGLCRLAKTAVLSFSTFPLTIFYVIGLSALALFVALAGFSLFCRLFTDLAIPGWTSHILSASFFGALNALGISILGEYVVRIYDQVRARPIYLVKRTANLDATDAAGSSATLPARSAMEAEEDQVLAELSGLLQELKAYRQRTTDRGDRTAAAAGPWPDLQDRR